MGNDIVDKSINIVLGKGKVCVLCNGCPENRMDVARAQKYLINNGWIVTEKIKDADIILFNTCGLSNGRENNSLNIIDEIEKKLRKEQRLIVWGCLPKINYPALAKRYNGLVSFGSELVELESVLGLVQPIGTTTANYLGPLIDAKQKQGFTLYRVFRKPILIWQSVIESRINIAGSRRHAFFYIDICRGCISNCAYCAVQKSRGRVKSKTIENILKEFKLGMDNGYHNFALMGTDVGAYGTDINKNLIDLLRGIFAIKGNYKIYLRNVNPSNLKVMMNEMVSFLRSGKLVYIEIPVESGSNRILKLMNRNYTVEEYKNIIKTLRQAFPALIIRTQVMVGFPSETEIDFRKTVQLIDEIAFDYIEVYSFSSRPGIAAEIIQPKVSEYIKRQRFSKLEVKAIFNRTSRKIKNIF